MTAVNLAPAPVEIVDAVGHVGERRQVAHPLADGEHGHRASLILGEVITADGLRVESGQSEVRVVHQHVLHAGRPERPRQLRLPHPLGQPHPAGTDAEMRSDELRQALDLPPLVGVGQDGQDRFVEAAREQLHLTPGHGLAEEIEGGRRALAQPGEQAAREVNGQAGVRMGEDALQERTIGALGRLFQHRLEIAHGLVVVDAEAQVQPLHYSRSRSRCTTEGATPMLSRKRRSSSTKVTERCRPPVQPTATVR